VVQNTTKFRSLDELANHGIIMHGLGEAELSVLSWANGSSTIKFDFDQAETLV
jgi:hypothetical protein